MDKNIQNIISHADGLLITAGAGMGIDSGLPDFRGENGFWRVYPALKKAGIDFYSIANPRSFATNPKLAWGFYGHRLNLYRTTLPHDGFGILQRLSQKMQHGAFVFTSNVDGQFQKAGFSESQIVECHGSIHYMQCLNACHHEVVTAKDFHPIIDEASCQLLSPLPTCKHCGDILRPNVLMFDDNKWIRQRRNMQQKNIDNWLKKVNRLLVIEIGAGTGIPTVRNFSEQHNNGFLIRINPDEPQIPAYVQGTSLALTGLLGLQSLITT